MPRTKRTAQSPERGELLVAIMKDKADFATLQEHKWYRIPVDSAPKRWPPHWIAFYQTKVFEQEAFAIKYFGRVRDIQIVNRRQLFPNEIPSARSEREYYQIWLDDLEHLERPIYSTRWRRIVFIPTTWRKFTQAVEINDIFDESPLEDRLWAKLKQLKISAERQWDLQVSDARYLLDFAVFCQKGSLDIETDGDTWHANRKRIPKDNQRDNALQSAAWHVLRFNGKQIRESVTEYCVPQITNTINRLGGLNDEGLVPRKFYNLPEGVGQQLTLLDKEEEINLE